MEQLEAKVIWKSTLWSALYSELRERGNGKTESGAFLLSNENSNEITEFICYDELEAGCLDRGYIHLTSKAFVRLWDYCYEKNLLVKADIHTHPGKITRQSNTDRKNPMIKVKGHIALILPYYAIPKSCDMNLVGIHEFLGNGFKWRTWEFKDGIIKSIDA